MNLRYGIVSSLAKSIRHVNDKYREPKIEMTPFVKGCLLVLRLYLIALVGLMIFKFAMAARG